MKTHITSIFDKNHLARALACRASLYRHAPDSPVYWLCLDQESYSMVKKLGLKNTTAFRPEDIHDQELLDIRKTRTNPEFSSTCKPAFLRYMLNSGIVGSEDLLMFVDPDFYFYEDSQPLFEKIHGLGSIVITPHRFPLRRSNDQYVKGVYNAGIVFFRNDINARKCLEEWRRQCIDWCYLRYEDGKIGDQGYMSDWPKRYVNVIELADKGVNLSTWNIENYKITRKNVDHFMVDDDILTCYHFHGLKLYFNSAGHLRAYPVSVFHSGIYKPCMNALQDAYDSLQKIDPRWTYGTLPPINMLRVVKQKFLKVFSK